MRVSLTTIRSHAVLAECDGGVRSETVEERTAYRNKKNEIDLSKGDPAHD